MSVAQTILLELLTLSCPFFLLMVMGHLHGIGCLFGKLSISSLVLTSGGILGFLPLPLLPLGCQSCCLPLSLITFSGIPRGLLLRQEVSSMLF